MEVLELLDNVSSESEEWNNDNQDDAMRNNTGAPHDV
jgi:hypothetical protein